MALRPEILVSMKRLEIVTDEDSLRELIRLVREAKVRGYTVIKEPGVSDRAGNGTRMITYLRRKTLSWL
ncbi:hypothetical protein SAMN05216299_11773 [Nitrosospira sp. Nsp14]|nr:hypothetical protein SAMN05216299_11773 [Nitrosospira sp. Nsp14]